ncbi:MAG: acyltransferase [Saprospiraceae bacterium]
MKLIEKITHRNHGIDVLRGLSILAVILLHLNIRFGYGDSFLRDLFPRQLFNLIFRSGYYGVIVFFTLSGYLITSSILKKWGTLSKIELGKFYWFRFARIMPLLCLLLIVLSTLHLSGISGFVINSERTSLTRAVFAALTFHVNWLEYKVGYLPANWDVLWSISIEEVFYLVFPIVCLLVKKRWQLLILLLIFLVLSPWARTQLFSGDELGSRNHLAFIDSIALGCTTALIAYNKTLPKLMNRLFLGLGWAMILLVFVFRSFLYQSGLTSLGMNITILSVGVSLVLFWMHEHQRSGQQKDRLWFAWIRRMGLYSYEIYLTHMFVVIWGVQVFHYFKLGVNWLVPYSLLLIWLSYLLGKVVFIYFSEPLNLWLRRRVIVREAEVG